MRAEIFIAALTCAAMLSLTACGSKESTESESTDENAVLRKELENYPPEVRELEYDNGNLVPIRIIMPDGSESEDSTVYENDLISIKYQGVSFEYDDNVRNTYYTFTFTAENKTDENMELCTTFGINDTVTGGRSYTEIYANSTETLEISRSYVDDISPVSDTVASVFAEFELDDDYFEIIDTSGPAEIVFSDDKPPSYTYEGFEPVYEDDVITVKKIGSYIEDDVCKVRLFVENKSSSSVYAGAEAAVNTSGDTFFASMDCFAPAGKNSVATATVRRYDGEVSEADTQGLMMTMYYTMTNGTETEYKMIDDLIKLDK